jgi:tripartite-type tricarboxylate transporter receptor subunit TctC
VNGAPAPRTGAPPDGYTYLFVFDTHAVNPTLIPNLPFDTVKDLAPVMLVATAPNAIVTNVAKPYRNFGDVIKAAKAKPDSVAIGTVALLTPFVKGGKLRAIAITGDKRSHALPDVPSLAEQGFPGFSALAWWGIFAPAGTPLPVLDRFHAELVKVFNQPDVRKQMSETLGMDLVVSSPAALQKFLVSEIARWAKVVRENNIRAD